nr:MAG TPA: hypothetical protein [Caudoviricetes sp.]
MIGDCNSNITLFYTFTLIIFRKSIILQSTDSLLFKG